MKTFKIGDYVQVANEGIGGIASTKVNNPNYEIRFLHSKLYGVYHISKLQPIEPKKLQRDLDFFAELTKRDLPIPQTEIYLYNPFFDPTPFFCKKKGRKITPRNIPKRHDYFWYIPQRIIHEKDGILGLPSIKISLEIDGGTFGGKSGHNTGVGINNGMEKANWCAYYGIHDLHVRPEQLMNELTFKFLEKVLL